MAAPVFAIPVLGTLLVSLVGSLATFLAAFVTKKIAFGLAAAIALATIITALLTTMRVIISGIEVAITDPHILMGLSIALPSNAAACLTAIATVWAACTLYAWQRTALDLFAKVS